MNRPERQQAEHPPGFEIVPTKKHLADDEISIYPHYVYLSADLHKHLGTDTKYVHVLSRRKGDTVVYCLCPAPSSDSLTRKISQRKVAVTTYKHWPSNRGYFRLKTTRDDTPAIYFVTTQKEPKR